MKNRVIAACAFACLILCLALIFSKCGKSRNENVYPVGAETDSQHDTVSSIGENDKIGKEPKPVNSKYRICVDPGHGYDDPGTGEESKYMNGVLEKDVTLQIGTKIYDILKNDGYDVVTTRKDDTKPQGYENRQYLFNVISRIEWLKENNGADLYVSVHCNSYPEDESIHGIRLYYCNGNGEAAENFANELANSISAGVPSDIKPSVNGYDYAKAFYVTKAIKIPSVLIEIGFVSNKTDAKNMTDGEWQDKFAESVISGIKSYIEKYMKDDA